MIIHVQEESSVENYQKVKDKVHLEKVICHVYHVQEELLEDYQKIKDKVTIVVSLIQMANPKSEIPKS
jgi:hypothetical protein